MKNSLWCGVSLLLLCVACGAEEETSTEAQSILDVPANYEFESRFEEGASSVSYSGQVARHVLLEDLKAYMAGMQEQIEGASFTPTQEGEVVAALDYYLRFDGDSNGGQAPLLRTEPAAAQSSYDEISTGKDLVGKLAGNDSATDHVDWSSQFAGWSDPEIASHGGSTQSPEGLVVAFFETFEHNALLLAEGQDRLGPDGSRLPVHVTASGLDLVQLTQKFLGGAVAFHQGADDYLDDDVEGKGLLSPNTQDGDSPYSSLEHAWDEGFGYFGAARDYSGYTDEEIAEQGYRDSDGDGAIDLTSECNFGASVNAAKRDLGSLTGVDFTGEASSAFLRGRAIIAGAGDSLRDDELDTLKKERDRALLAWEGAIAATVVHYINETLQVMELFGAQGYDFLEHAKVWSELKGFGLWFQFNPRSPLSDQEFVRFHQLVGDAPVLPDASQEEIEAYKASLLEARGLLGDAFGFEDADLGDAQGLGGW